MNKLNKISPLDKKFLQLLKNKCGKKDGMKDISHKFRIDKKTFNEQIKYFEENNLVTKTKKRIKKLI